MERFHQPFFSLENLLATDSLLQALICHSDHGDCGDHGDSMTLTAGREILPAFFRVEENALVDRSIDPEVFPAAGSARHPLAGLRP